MALTKVSSGMLGNGGGDIATNTALGTSALNSNTTGSTNTAIGRDALQANTVAARNTVVGYQAAYFNNANDTVVVGSQALYSNTTGASNTAIGRLALYSSTIATNNTAVGFEAGYTYNRTSDSDGYNTFIGNRSGYSATTGQVNTFVGHGSGNAMTTGSKNSILGSYSGNSGGLDIRTASNHIVLSDGDGNPRGWFGPSGNFTVTRSDFSGIQCPGCYNDTTGSAANVFITSGGSLVRSTSSRKYKKDIQDSTHGLADLMALRSVTYKGTGNHDNEQVLGGLIAEEVHDAGLTEFVQYAEDGTPDALAYGHMVSLCVKAIQEQQALISAQGAIITDLKARIEILEAK